MKKGFTLIELLAVIIILAIILVITVPGISGIIESAKKGALEDQVKLVQRAAVLKYGMNPSYDFSIVNKSNIKHELDIDVSTFDAVGIEVNNDKVTTTIIKDGITITSSNNPVINNAKVYGLSWDGNITFTRTDDATLLTTVQVGVGNEEVTNNFDTAEIYSEIVEETDEYGNQFIKIPKFYIKKTVKDNAWTWQISKNQKDADYYLPACFVDEEIGK
ncbi:MAG: prepilin-type N-terminal cleavage/methylation domain-containing protein, partial [Bacilli bacterium]|nr:prepilin-type N-terminal cleavage/methylation domain-containing protein [Bacilli bacterium]